MDGWSEGTRAKPGNQLVIYIQMYVMFKLSCELPHCVSCFGKATAV